MMASRADRLEELLVLRATQPLLPAERAELEALLDIDAAADRESFDRAAAAIHVAAMASRPALPGSLRARLEEQAARHFAAGGENAED